jgi:GMP synthase-like glutamine amidotransferase
MKPIAVFQHSENVQPGHFASFLNRHRLPWALIRVDLGESVPASAHDFSGLCFMGGPMSVNDALPWIEQELALIRDAVAREVPVIGHCLGGQLLSRALGGTVSRNAEREIGWTRVTATPTREARDWLGPVAAFDAFQWHGETFTLPPGATRILSSAGCAHQAYVIGPRGGIHLGMQFHIEMTEALIRTWNQEWADEFTPPVLGRYVQRPAEQFAQMKDALPAMRAMAERVYARWVATVGLDTPRHGPIAVAPVAPVAPDRADA